VFHYSTAEIKICRFLPDIKATRQMALAGDGCEPHLTLLQD